MTKIKIIFFILFVIQVFANAEELSVVEVKRNIPLSDDEPVYKDFAISGGTSSGLKKNLVVFAKRKVSIKDPSAKTIGEIETNVAQLKVIYADSKMAIAREYKLVSRDEEPMLEQIGVMTGDRIDLAGSFIDTKPLVYKKKVREPSSVAQAPQAASPAPAPLTPDAMPTVPTDKQPAPPTLQIKPNPTPLPEI
jgi:hypothetical protein